MEINTDTDTSNSNKGTGAGGANTNKNGKSFEEKTNNESRLLNKGFIRENINIGNKIMLYPSLSSTNLDYAIGVEDNDMFFY